MSSPGNAGKLVISLDFELYWGLRDQVPLDSYRLNLLGVRQAIPAILQLFRDFGVRATWATVGLLCFSQRDELLRHLPARRPQYREARLSPYDDLGVLGANEAADPFHFGGSLLRMIAGTPGQEIATHTFSHYYCCEPGQQREEFEADLRAALDTAAMCGHTLRSIVFPRNQVNQEYLASCAEVGLIAYRGNPPSPLWRGGGLIREPRWRRLGRLAEAYMPISERLSYADRELGEAPPFNVRASRFLRPYSSQLRMLEPLRRRKLCRELTDAARAGEIYHLWWHPHNFGVNLQENLAILHQVLETFAAMRSAAGMTSASMGEVAEERAARLGLSSAVGSSV